MTDREKVLKGLECCAATNSDECRKCPYSDECWIDSLYGISHLAGDALALLKEQEPVKAVADGEDSFICNNCGTVIGWDAWEPGGVEEVKDKFCPECGRPVKWDA